MDNKILYSVTGLFDTPDEIYSAAGKVANAGYKHYDINTPYPVHGLSQKMGLKPSTLGYFALALGLTGTAIALILVYWTMSIDYPLVIGGKPYFSFPAYIPVIFELTVLLASVGTVLVMLFYFFKLPNNSHPLHDTDYMKHVSVDKFGVSIEAKDKLFDEAKVKEFLESLGAKSITSIYFDEKEIGYKPKVFEKRFIIFLVASFIVVSGASYFVLNKLLNLPPFDMMWSQHKIKPQSASMFFKDGFGNRAPVEGTVARGHLPYPYPDQPDIAEVMLVNQLPITKENLELGKKKFNTYCSPCHGFLGKGDARLNGQFPNPPSLHTDRVRNWKDGRIYHIITMGQNIMPSYAKQLTENERWAVVNYVRVLERALNAKEEDLK